MGVMHDVARVRLKQLRLAKRLEVYLKMYAVYSFLQLVQEGLAVASIARDVVV